jgi:uncharacterized repeat protein (TIGR01451 family)
LFAPGSNAGANLDQWANGQTPPTGESWQNGNLNGNNSAYAEGKAVPFRLAIEGLTPGTHFITIQYDFTAGGHKAYDFLASIEATEPNALTQICGVGGGGVSSLCSNGAMSVARTTFGFPDDDFAPGPGAQTVTDAMANDPVPRQLSIFGGTITDITAVTHAGNVDGNSTGQMVVEFTSTGSAVLLAWSGHLARSPFWNAPTDPDGAGEVTGAPWHMRTLNLDGGGAANQDRSIQPSAIVDPPSLTLVKSTTTPSVTAGDAVNYTVTVTNAGPGTATGVTISDNLPGIGAGTNWTIQSDEPGDPCSITGTAPAAQTLNCGPVSLIAGASLTATVTSPTTAATCPSLSNTATATTTFGSITGSPTQAVVITVDCPANLSLAKSSTVTTVNAGDAVNYTMTVTNAGPGAATGVTITDNLPGAGTDWSIQSQDPAAACAITGALGSEVLNCGPVSLAAGASLTVTVTSNTTAASCPSLSNTASASATGATVSGSPTSAVVITVDCPDVKVTKTAVNATVNAGDAVGFTIVVENLGPGTAKSVTLSDNLPGGLTWIEDSADCSIAAGVLTCSFGDLASGATRTINLSSTSSAAARCTTLPNTATVAATNEPSNKLANNSDDATITVTCPVLTISKTPDQAGDAGYSVVAGGTAKFTITVNNTGTGAATNVLVKDTLPNGDLNWAEDPDKTECTVALDGAISKQVLTCTIASLAAGGSFSVSVSTTVPADYIQDDPEPAGDPIEIDGNLADGAAAGKDWATVGIVCQTVGCKLDEPTGQTDNAFGQGTKEDTPVPTIVFGSIPNNKSDLLRFYVANERFVQTDFLYLAWERVQAPNGTTNMDFELNQSATLSANGVTSVRTAGDILVKFDLARGGTNPTLGFHRWVTAASAGGQTAAQACEASNSFPCWGKVTDLAGDPDVAAAINLVSVEDPINPDAPRMLDALTFGEASINLQGTGIFTPGACVSFGRAYLKSRSSDSFSSEIKDFISPIPISVSNCQPRLIPNKAWVSASNFAPAGGNLGDGISNTGEIQVTVPNGSASLFTAPAGRDLAQVDASVTLAAGVVSPDIGAFEPSGFGGRPAAARERAANPWSVRAVSAVGAGAEGLEKSIPRTRRVG